QLGDGSQRFVALAELFQPVRLPIERAVRPRTAARHHLAEGFYRLFPLPAVKQALAGLVKAIIAHPAFDADPPGYAAADANLRSEGQRHRRMEVVLIF